MTNGMPHWEEMTIQSLLGVNFRKAFGGFVASRKIGKPHDLSLREY